MGVHACKYATMLKSMKMGDESMKSDLKGGVTKMMQRGRITSLYST
jgi:hypothetical protein